MNENEIDLTTDEKTLIRLFRKFKNYSYADIKVEVRNGRIGRIVPTISLVISPVQVGDYTKEKKNML